VSSGFPEAQFFLGVVYFNGEGVPEIWVMAYMWFDLASSSWYVDAKIEKLKLKKILSRKEIAKAKQLRRDWEASTDS
jgi:TPR repeat protein